MDETPHINKVRIRRGVAVVLAVYWCALFAGTHIPNADTIMPSNVSDKSLHFFAYAGLAFLASLWQSFSGPLRPSRMLGIFLIVIAYGVVDEMLQLIPFLRRFAEVTDWIADVAGALTGIVVFWIANRLFLARWRERLK